MSACCLLSCAQLLAFWQRKYRVAVLQHACCLLLNTKRLYSRCWLARSTKCIKLAGEVLHCCLLCWAALP